LHRYALAAQSSNGKDVLDIASGEGYGSNLLATSARSVVGVDISREAVTHAAHKYRRSNLKYVQGDAAAIPLPARSVDMVVSFETIEHHDKHEEMMLEIRRVLRPGGLLMISSPDKLNYSDIPGYRNAYHVKELYLDEFRALLDRHFSFTRMMLQKVVLGSIIYPEHEAVSEFEYYTGNLASVRRLSGPEGPMYNICIASDAETVVPALGVCIFDSETSLTRLNERASHLEARVASLTQEVVDLRSSWSFRLGRAITVPIRWLRDL